ncbi:MAG: hypothetical protein RBG13Loki_1738 [Promethearchaeota archaeon CR_4]|nr:MAG: hypothetical protein RBG13Loki_1738 [Candidatus Lokiarchaeota archaeon CR_4]
MKLKACLDTGVITQFYSKDVPEKIKNFKNQIKTRTIDACTLFPLVAEATFHICKLEGKDAALQKISNFLNTYPIRIILLDSGTSIKAGLLRCQHRRMLSYNDCLAIAFCLNNKYTLHTTEKKLKDLIPNLSLTTYFF